MNALSFFNVGVELGHRIQRRALAAYWMIERVLEFWA